MTTRMESSKVLATRAEEVLRQNDMGDWTKASPDLYPHQWSWDAPARATVSAI